MPDEPLEISVLEAKRLMAAKGAALRVIDVRDPEEHAFCRLPGSELLPLSGLSAAVPARLPDKNAEILVYCHHGMRSLNAANYLRQAGYANVRSIAGGIERWSLEIDSLVSRY